MKKSETLKFAITMISLTVSIGILILLFCWICYLIPIDFPGTIGEWITAFSSLAGGSLTLGGVWWTIKVQDEIRVKENKKRDKERRIDYEILYRPLIQIKTQDMIKLDNGALFFKLHIKNIGRGELYKGKIADVQIETDLNKNICCETQQRKVFIPVDMTETFDITISNIEWKFGLINLTLKFIYTDIFKNEKYINIYIKTIFSQSNRNKSNIAIDQYSECSHVFI